jgi:hypothetical protein
VQGPSLLPPDASRGKATTPRLVSSCHGELVGMAQHPRHCHHRYLPILAPYRRAGAASSADFALTLCYSRVASTPESSTMLHFASEPEMIVGTLPTITCRDPRRTYAFPNSPESLCHNRRLRGLPSDHLCDVRKSLSSLTTGA